MRLRAGVDKIYKPLARLIKNKKEEEERKKRKRIQINKIKNEREVKIVTA